MTLLRCPKCGFVGQQIVTNSRTPPYEQCSSRFGKGWASGENSEVMRRRECGGCGERFTTVELVRQGEKAAERLETERWGRRVREVLAEGWGAVG